MKIKITADSTCDLSPELVKQNNITLVPLTVEMNGRTYRDSVDIFPEDIFANVDAGGQLCTTAAVNMMEYRTLFETMTEEYDAVIHINLGSGFSSCYQNACAATADMDNVYVVDSQNLSTGQGYLVLAACERAQTCTDPAALSEELRAMAGRMETSFLLDRLDYMVKGGRCSSVVALGANLLKLKPCIEVVNGKMRVGKKYRGSYAKCMTQYLKDRLDGRQDIRRGRVFITHTRMQPDVLEAAQKGVAEFGGFRQTLETIAGCTISCHCGPNCLGVLFERSE